MDQPHGRQVGPTPGVSRREPERDSDTQTSGGDELLRIANARIQEGVEDVDHQVRQYERHAEQQDDTLDQSKVVGQDAGHHHAADAPAAQKWIR